VSSSAGHVLIFAEDPGAANFVAELPAALAARGVGTTFLSAGAASAYLGRRGIETGTLERGDVDCVLDELAPSCVLVGTAENPDTAGLVLIDAARGREVVSVGAIDAPANAAYRFRGCADGSLTHRPDWLLVPEDWTARAFSTLGFPANRIVVCGHPHFDCVRAYAARPDTPDRQTLRRALVPNADSTQKVVIFAAEPSTGLDPHEYRRSAGYELHGRGRSDERTAIVLEEFLEAAAGIQPRPYIVLRLHPKDTASEFDAYVPEIDQISQDELALDMIIASDAVVGMTTMLIVEAVLLGRPTLSIVPRRQEEEWLPTISLGLTPCAHTRPEVKACVAALLSGKEVPSSAAVADALPSGGTARAADFLARLVGE